MSRLADLPRAHRSVSPEGVHGRARRSAGARSPARGARTRCACDQQGRICAGLWGPLVEFDRLATKRGSKWAKMGLNLDCTQHRHERMDRVHTPPLRGHRVNPCSQCHDKQQTEHCARRAQLQCAARCTERAPGARMASAAVCISPLRSASAFPHAHLHAPFGCSSLLTCTSFQSAARGD
jgi:hypothetical protein